MDEVEVSTEPEGTVVRMRRRLGAVAGRVNTLAEIAVERRGRHASSRASAARST